MGSPPNCDRLTQYSVCPGAHVFVQSVAQFACPPAPLLLGSILGPMMEENLRRTLLISGGDASVFVSRPISAGLLLATALLVVLLALPALRTKREEAFQEEG